MVTLAELSERDREMIAFWSEFFSSEKPTVIVMPDRDEIRESVRRVYSGR